MTLYIKFTCLCSEWLTFKSLKKQIHIIIIQTSLVLTLYINRMSFNSQLTSNTQLSCYSLPVCSVLPPLALLSKSLLYEAPLMALWGIYWTSPGDLTHCVCACACTCTYKHVCLPDCGVGCDIIVLLHSCYCVHSHSKAIRFYTKPQSWEL